MPVSQDAGTLDSVRTYNFVHKRGAAQEAPKKSRARQNRDLRQEGEAHDRGYEKGIARWQLGHGVPRMLRSPEPEDEPAK